MIQQYIFDLQDASEAGLNGHPQLEILHKWPAATNLVPESLFDCWTFEHEELPEPLPPYLRKPNPPGSGQFKLIPTLVSCVPIKRVPIKDERGKCPCINGCKERGV